MERTHDNGGTCFFAANGDPLFKLQDGEPFILFVDGPHPLDVRMAHLSRDDLKAVQKWATTALVGSK